MTNFIDHQTKMDLSRYRHVFCDLDNTIAFVKDGTLQIPSDVVEAINNLNNNIGFSICTARCLEEVIEIEGMSNILMRSPFILENGAVILTPGRSVVKQHVLPEKTADSLIRFLDRFKVWKKVCIGGMLTGFQEVRELNNITKIGLQDLTEEMLETIFRKLSEYADIAYFGSQAAHKPGTFTLDITNIQATKQQGVFSVLDLMKINRQDAIGIGDSDNDFPMLEACGLKIAVANAKLSIKAIADFVIPSCEEGGVATILPRLGKK